MCLSGQAQCGGEHRLKKEGIWVETVRQNVLILMSVASFGRKLLMRLRTHNYRNTRDSNNTVYSSKHAAKLLTVHVYNKLPKLQQGDKKFS